MARTANPRKSGKSHGHYLECPHCGKTLDTRTATQAKYPSARRILMQGIVAALEAGPGTPAEIDARMGVRSTERTATLCRVLERKNLIKKIATIGDRPGRITAPVGIYALVIAATDSASPVLDTQAIEGETPNHNESPRGARA